VTALRPWLAVAAVALLGAAWWHGHTTGTRAEATRQALALAAAQDRAMRTAELLSRAEAARLAALAARDALYLDLEDAAREDPDDTQCTLPAGRVRRLNLR
jgi:hypothetical protein